MGGEQVDILFKLRDMGNKQRWEGQRKDNENGVRGPGHTAAAGSLSPGTWDNGSRLCVCAHPT